MAKKNKIHWEDEPMDDAPSPPPPPVAPPLRPPGESGAPAGQSDDEQTVADDLADLKTKADELEAKLLRAAADYQNVVRRSQQNVAAAREQTVMEVARDLLTVMDHFDHAVNFDADAADPRALLEGVIMVRDELMRILERHGVKRMPVSRGDEFDPNKHEAMMRHAAQGIETNQVVDQLQPGYTIGEKTLRPAKVSVAE